jgi:DNA adenine methylase
LVVLNSPVLPKAKPFIKWVGGKRQLLSEIHLRLPKTIEQYFEPFVGGGALLFSLEQTNVKSMIISDGNFELINLYQVVRDQPQALIEALNEHQNTKVYYYKIRQMDRKPNYSSTSSIFKASRFIYLNKTGFNGLYRVNSKGQNNVPFGRYANPNFINDDNINACSKFLQGVTIFHGDFENIKPMLTQKSFVYFDPPYMPLSVTSSFTGYTKDQFDYDTQIRLRLFCDYIDQLGGKFMLSNSSAPVIFDLYKNYVVDEIQATRLVNCQARGRGKISELIIRNYKT